MIRCIIVEDEPLAQQVISNHITMLPELELVAICGTALAAFDILLREKIDLIFLDIKLPSITGIDFIKTLKDPPAVIFTTAYSDFAIESYELNAVDYLLKPITLERFKASIHKYLKLNVTEISAQKTHTFFKVNGKFIKIQHADILFAQSVKDYIVINTGLAEYVTHMTMKYLTELLPTQPFIRVHRSFLINIDNLDAVGKHEVLIGKYSIPLGKQYVSEEMLKQRLG